jgi:hypothetical protein
VESYKERIEIFASLDNVPLDTLHLDTLALMGGLQQRAIHVDSVTFASIQADSFRYGIGKILVVERVWTDEEWEQYTREGKAPQDMPMPKPLRSGSAWSGGGVIDLRRDPSREHRRLVVVDGNHRVKALKDLKHCEGALQTLKTDVQLLDCAETDRVR